MIPYAGPLFYPPIGMVAVTQGGCRIEVWPDESESCDCFTGLLLEDGRTETQRVVFDLSCMWNRTQIDHIEEPTADDLRLGWLPRPNQERPALPPPHPVTAREMEGNEMNTLTRWKVAYEGIVRDYFWSEHADAVAAHKEYCDARHWLRRDQVVVL